MNWFAILCRADTNGGQLKIDERKTMVTRVFLAEFPCAICGLFFFSLLVFCLFLHNLKQFALFSMNVDSNPPPLSRAIIFTLRSRAESILNFSKSYA